MHFYFYMPATDIVGNIMYSNYGKLYFYVVYLICIDADICMYRTVERAVASTFLEIAEGASED